LTVGGFASWRTTPSEAFRKLAVWIGGDIVRIAKYVGWILLKTHRDSRRDSIVKLLGQACLEKD